MSAALTEGMEPDIDTVLVLNEVGQKIPMKLIVPLYSKSAVAAVVLAERERICAAIKAEDDHCATGDYMLDSDDCIAVARGTWVRPDYSVTEPAAIRGQK
jgi:hypothetical protein